MKTFRHGALRSRGAPRVIAKAGGGEVTWLGKWRRSAVMVKSPDLLQQVFNQPGLRDHCRNSRGTHLF
jgi:hypothetical protein